MGKSVPALFGISNLSLTRHSTSQPAWPQNQALSKAITGLITEHVTKHGAADALVPGSSDDAAGLCPGRTVEASVAPSDEKKNYRRIRSAITKTVGAVRVVISASSRNLFRTQRIGPLSLDSAVSCGPTLIEPDCPRPVRRGLRFFADRIRRSEFARAVMTHAPGRRNSQCAGFHGERVSGALLPC